MIIGAVTGKPHIRMFSDNSIAIQTTACKAGIVIPPHGFVHVLYKRDASNPKKFAGALPYTMYHGQVNTSTNPQPGIKEDLRIITEAGRIVVIPTTHIMAIIHTNTSVLE